MCVWWFISEWGGRKTAWDVEEEMMPQCFCAGGGPVRTQSPTHPSPIDPPTSLLHYDITLCRPSQPRLVGSDERESQLVPRSHVIRSDVAASAAGWARALHSLIRSIKGGGCLCAVCAPVYVLIWPQTLETWQSGKAFSLSPQGT